MAAPTANATTRALSNFDIAEQIILWLPLREMLFSNRVCKAWKAVYDHPSRVRKALFLSPATENRIYYPDCSKSTWYMAPDRSELDQAGLLSAPAEESDDDITLTNSPKRLAAQSQRPESTTEAESAETAEAFKGKRDFSFTPEVEAMIAAGGTEGKVGIMANVARGYGKGRGSQAAGGKQAGGDTETAKQQIDSKSMAFYHSELSKSTATKLTELADHTSNVRIPDELVDLISKAKISAKVVDRKSTLTPDMMAAAEEGVVTIQNNVPRSLDGTMMVSRVTPPFLNPFCELFVDLFHEGACGRFVHAGWVDVPGRGRFWYDDLIIQPPSRLPDGSVPGKSSKVRAVQRYNASWRKMHPLSANTASIIVECFSHGFLTLRPEFAWALLAGEMMEQLGTHWAHECPKCCVTDYWFGKLIKKVGKCDCGKLGVRKLELDQIGWHVIAELSANEVQSTGQQDRIVPLGAYGS